MSQQKQQLSMDEIDRQSFNASGTPFTGTLPSVTVELLKSSIEEAKPALSLDGDWQLCCADGSRYPGFDWNQAVPAPVPGSIHTALFRAGKIPDPTVGTNQTIARHESYKAWAYKKTFPMPAGTCKRYRLEFDGICNRCTIWLNGGELGRHEGMFGGPEYDVTDLLQPQNELVVLLDAIPFEPAGVYPENNASWKNTVVINNVYGWHYSNMPSLGIWRSVRLVAVPDVELLNQFIATRKTDPAEMMLTVDLKGPELGFNGMLNVEITPYNFSGKAYSFACPVQSGGSCFSFKAAFTLPEAKLWWPVDLGDPNLYKLRLAFQPDNGAESGDLACIFGVRTVEMAPLPDGPSPDLYNWTFVINGRKIFVKGTGWCTADAMLDFSEERLGRFITLARDQHCQMVRAWGSGMPETNEFYALCDKNGVMVLQEWPTAWDSHFQQPYEMLEDTVRRNTFRLRNHPSLVMWGAGNESGNPTGKAIDMMGRLATELDGTRPFHRCEPWGGSKHDYTCYWGYAPLDHNLKLTSRFFGEFGLACMPSYESVLRYLAPEDRAKWPMADNATLRYHTPIFGHYDDVNRQMQYARYFVPDEATLEEITIGSQLSQAVGVRHPLERARTRWPHCSGALYYKMNDNFPAASWSCVDWYGAPKISHYLFQDAFAPLAPVVLFDTLNSFGTHIDLPVFLLDDAGFLKGCSWETVVRAYDKNLNLIREVSFPGQGEIIAPLELGKLTLTADETRTAPLLVTAEVVLEGHLAQRTFYFINYEYDKGCLFRLPRASLCCECNKDSGIVRVTNNGAKPAVAVHVKCPGHLHELSVSDNYFWLNPGESKTVSVNLTDGINVSAWNSI